MSVKLQPTIQSASMSPSFHADDDESLQNYHSLSVLALVALAIGVLSPLCFAAPLLLTIPLAGIAVALVALRRIAVSDGALAGRWLASAGLALSVGSLLALFSHGQVLQFLHVQRAAEFGNRWLAIVQSGDTEQAFQLMSQSAQSAPPQEMPGAPQVNPYDEFVADPLIKQIAAAGADAQIRLNETLSYDLRTRGMCLVRQRFDVTPVAKAGIEAQPAAISVDLTLQRARLPRELQSRWLVVGYKNEDVPAVNGLVH